MAPFLPPWLAVSLATDGAQLESGYSELSVTYDTPRADPATTDATVARDWLAGWLVAIHDPSQSPSQQHERCCSPAQHHVTEWIPFYAVPAPRYLGNSSISWRIDPVSCLSSCLPDGAPPLLYWLQSLVKSESGLAMSSSTDSKPFLVLPRSISPIGLEFLDQALPGAQIVLEGSLNTAD